MWEERDKINKIERKLDDATVSVIYGWIHQADGDLGRYGISKFLGDVNLSDVISFKKIEIRLLLGPP